MHGTFMRENREIHGDLLATSPTPAAFLRLLQGPGLVRHDQWHVQIQALIQRRARVLVKNAVIDDTTLRRSWLEPIHDVSATVAALLAEAGPGARLAVVPQGPQTVPYYSPHEGVTAESSDSRADREEASRERMLN